MYKFTEEHRANIAKSKVGEKNPMWGKSPNEAQLAGLKLGWGVKKDYTHLIGNKHAKGKVLAENNASWKGISVSYSGIHKYIKRHKPVSSECQSCGKLAEGTRLELSRLHTTHEKSRNPEDYRFLCVSCHRRYDRESYMKKEKTEVA